MKPPSRKWFADRVVQLTALVTMWATTHGWDLEETLAAIGLVSAGALSYLIPNSAQDVLNQSKAAAVATLESRGRRT